MLVYAYANEILFLNFLLVNFFCTLNASFSTAMNKTNKNVKNVEKKLLVF